MSEYLATTEPLTALSTPKMELPIVSATRADDCAPLRKGHFNLERAEKAVRDLLLAVGEDPDREGLLDTPRRVARMYREILSGLQADPAEHLKRVFNEECDDMVILKDIRFSSLCEHHLLPFMGKAHVAYLPNGNVVGLSKLARTVEVFAKRPQVQERLTAQIANALMKHLNAKGAMVVIESEHLCMKIRGVKNSGSRMVTKAVRGIFREDRGLRGTFPFFFKSFFP